MKTYAIWIDREEAKIFEMEDGTHTVKQLHGHYVDHHTHVRDGVSKQREENSLFNQVSKYIQNATQLVIIGPGVAKYHFHNHLTEHHPVLERKIIACQTVDHPTEGQIVARVRNILADYALTVVS